MTAFYLLTELLDTIECIDKQRRPCEDCVDAQTRCSSTMRNRMANSVDPEPSHLDLHCLQQYLAWSIRLKACNLSFPYTSL